MAEAKGAGKVAGRQRRFRTGALGSQFRTKPSIPKTGAPSMPTTKKDRGEGALQFTSPEFQASLTPQATQRMGNVPFTTVSDLPFGWVDISLGGGLLLKEGITPEKAQHALLHTEPGAQGSAIFNSLSPQQQLAFKWSYLAGANINDAVEIQKAITNLTPGQRAITRLGAGPGFIANEMRLGFPGATEREVFPTLYETAGSASGIPVPQRGFYADTFRMSAFAGPNVNKRRYNIVRR